MEHPSAKTSAARILPVLFGFFVMGFCDLVGVATSYVKQDFGWSETLAGFVPSMVFIWFFFLSVPAAVAMDRIGRKNMVHLSNLFTFVGMILPMISYNVATCLSAFALLGIGNTIIQVALNPLLTNVVSGKRLTSALTLGQVIKAVCSFSAPLICGVCAAKLGNWQYVFPIFAAVAVISEVWLRLTKIPREAPSESSATFGATISLLKEKKVLLLFLGIFFVVGLDVAVNTVAPKLLMERAGMALSAAGIGSSVYFLCKTLGNFIGTFMLLKCKDSSYFKANIFLTLIAVAALFFAGSRTVVLILIAGIGFFCASIFSLIYSAALKSNPGKENGISGLMIMGVSGGAVTPPLMGLCADAAGSQTGSLVVIAVCVIYLIFCAFYVAGLERGQ